MFNGSYAPSLADIAAVNGNNNDGFGNNSWWAIILLVALFRGGLFGNNGGCGCQNGNSDAVTKSDLCSEMNFQGLRNDTRNISDNVNNGFSGLNSTICAQQYDTANMFNNFTTTYLQSTNAQNIASLQNQNALMAAITNCCCDIKALFAQAENARSRDTCDITRAIQDAARDIIQNDNCNYRQLHDEQIELRFQQKDAQISELQGALNKCDIQNIVNNAVQSAVNQIHPDPVPSWNVPNPFASYNGGGCYNNPFYGTNVAYSF